MTRVEVWETELREKPWERIRRRLFPQLFRVISNLHECSRNFIPNRERKLSISFIKYTVTKTFYISLELSLFNGIQQERVLSSFQPISARVVSYLLLLTNQRACSISVIKTESTMARVLTKPMQKRIWENSKLYVNPSHRRILPNSLECLYQVL